jgi:hypothetical protein
VDAERYYRWGYNPDGDEWLAEVIEPDDEDYPGEVSDTDDFRQDMVEKAKRLVAKGDPLEADATLKNYCEICFGSAEPPCEDCPIEPYLQTILRACEEQRKAEKEARNRP